MCFSAEQCIHNLQERIEKSMSLAEDVPVSGERMSYPVDSNGKDITIPGTGISLHIPEGAIPIGTVVPVSLSLPITDNFPPLEQNHTLICPIVRCEPKETSFLKHVELTLPSCAVTKDSNLNVTVWTTSHGILTVLF